MKFNKLGKTDLNVSLICLGTMTWGVQNNQDEAFGLMDYAFDQGINFFDTAEQYSAPSTKESYGKSETIIGNWFKQKNNREKVILATKISGPGVPWIRGGGLQYTEKNITTAIECSLKRLKTDYIDLYQLHWPEREDGYFGNFRYNYKKWNSFESILKVLKKFIDQGKIRHIGVSNETTWGLKKYLELSNSHNLPRIVSIQNGYNLLNRNFESDLAETSIKEKSGLLAYSPLAFGFLSGKYRNNKRPKGSRLQLFNNYFVRYSGKLSSLAIEEYFKIAQKHNISFPQLSLAFVNQQPFITSSIIGATNKNQLKENMDSINISLSPEILGEINLIHKKNKNPSNHRDKKIFIERIPSYILSGSKLALKGDWSLLNNKLNKILIKPIKNLVKK
jgi:aryl-alcohol dehydrogenase-like predicted oxidoreductase